MSFGNSINNPLIFLVLFYEPEAKMKAELILTGPHINMDNPILKQ